MKGIFPVDRFSAMDTPFYYYDTDLLRDTLRAINAEVGRHDGFVMHYAIKATMPTPRC